MRKSSAAASVTLLGISAGRPRLIQVISFYAVTIRIGSKDRYTRPANRPLASPGWRVPYKYREPRILAHRIFLSNMLDLHIFVASFDLRWDWRFFPFQATSIRKKETRFELPADFLGDRPLVSSRLHPVRPASGDSR